MGLRDELGDPWGVLIGGVAGGLAWATGIAPVAAVGIGAAVLAVKVVAGIAGRDKEPRDLGERVLPVDWQSTEGIWVRRADRAVRSFDEVCESVRVGPIAERVNGFRSETHETYASLRRLAGQAGAVGQALHRLDPVALERERQRLTAAVEASSSERVRDERSRSLASVGAQIDTLRRLAEARETLLARVESGTIALEGLVARLTEVVALTETTASSVEDTTQVESLAAELEGLRAGLVEAESVSTRALGALQVPAPGSVPPRGRAASR